MSVAMSVCGSADPSALLTRSTECGLVVYLANIMRVENLFALERRRSLSLALSGFSWLPAREGAWVSSQLPILALHHTRLVDNYH